MLDMKMPGKSGMDLLPELKTGYPGIAVIMATAVAESNLAIRCVRLGADDYITKPFNLDEIVMCVEKVLEKRELELQISEYQQQLQQKVEHQTAEIRALFLGSIESLVFALEAKDKYTAGHSRGGLLKLHWLSAGSFICPRKIWRICVGADLLHDVGKIAVDQFVPEQTG